MIEPYDTLIKSRLKELEEIGFFLQNDDDFSIVLSNKTSRLAFNTERYYHPSLTITITDRLGCRRVLELLKRVLDSELAQKDKSVFNSLGSRYDFKHSSFDELLASGGFSAYVDIILDQAIYFLNKYCETLNHLPADKQIAYTAESKSVLADLGLNIRTT